MIARLATAVALLMVAVHVAQGLWFVFPSGQIKNLHLGFALVLLALVWLEKTPRAHFWTRVGLALFLLLALAPVAYIHLEYESLVSDRVFSSEPLDGVAAVLLLGVAAVVAWREMGLVIPGLALASLLYARYGYVLPGDILFHSGIGWERLLGYTSIPSFRGLLGAFTEESANTIFVFMVYAGVLEATGGLAFIMKLAYGLGGQTRAGPAQVAVVSSGLMGMINGSTVANVVTTGAFTIPMMKRVGFRPPFAGAVEAVASTGGQITPPVMGLAAFLMVGITGIPYQQIVIAAALPAIIFYLQLMAAVHIQAVKSGLNAVGRATGLDAELDAMGMGRACLEYGHLLLSVAVLVWVMMAEDRTGYAALSATAVVLVGEALKQLWKHRRAPLGGLRAGLAAIVKGLDRGARGGAQIAVVVAVIGIMVEMLVATGFAQKLSFAMLSLAGGSLWLLLLIAALTCLAFGCGLPTSASYILVALLGAPALVEFGIPLLAAHLFVFYFANVSAITPPVAVGALVAANMAGAGFMRTSLIALRLGVAGYLLPFLFVARPEILGLGEASLGAQLFTGFAALIAVVALNAAMEGWALAPLHWVERLLLLPAAFGLLEPGWLTTVIGLGIVAVILARQILATRATPAAPPPSDVGAVAPLAVDLSKLRSDGP